MQPSPPHLAPACCWRMQASGVLLCWELPLGTQSVDFIYLFFLPVMLPSEIPKLPTDHWWGFLVFGNFSFKTPFPGQSPSLTILSLFLSFIFCLPSFEDNGLLFWVADILCQHSEVVLWSLLSVQMYFWWICGGYSGLPILFLQHLSLAPSPTPAF